MLLDLFLKLSCHRRVLIFPTHQITLSCLLNQYKQFRLRNNQLPLAILGISDGGAIEQPLQFHVTSFM